MGQNLDVDNFVAKSGLKPYKKNYKGQPKLKTKPTGDKLKYSLIAIETSKAEFNNLKRQIKDTVAYLTKNKTKLKHISLTKEVQHARLDFGIDLMVDKTSNLIQTLQLPKKLLQLVGDIGLDIELSLYPVDLQETLEKLSKRRQRNSA